MSVCVCVYACLRAVADVDMPFLVVMIIMMMMMMVFVNFDSRDAGFVAMGNDETKYPNRLHLHCLERILWLWR